MYPYRKVSLFLVLKAPMARADEVAAAVKAELAPHGRVDVRNDGPYWKYRELLDFVVDIWPDGSAVTCAESFGLDDSGPVAWTREQGGVFLHPAVEWVRGIDVCQALGPPKFAEGDLVRIVGGAGTARVTSVHSPLAGEPWEYLLRVPGRDQVVGVGEQGLVSDGSDLRK